jgi:hypothetical protein
MGAPTGLLPRLGQRGGNPQYLHSANRITLNEVFIQSKNFGTSSTPRDTKQEAKKDVNTFKVSGHTTVITPM